MGDSRYLEGLTQLHRLRDTEAQRSVWRHSIATLAAQASDLRPAPLEGLDPGAIQASVRIALASGFVDGLDWLSPAHAGAALYELAAAVPMGEERRELGRRVLQLLHDGEAETFVALATRLARTSRKALSGAPLRARVALALRLPARTLASADRLALTLICHPALEREWLTVPSEGSLPSRRLAARLLERAAREATRRVTTGDKSVLRVFDTPSVRAAWDRLLADREPLVWRHVAVARGLLSNAVQRFGDELVRDVDVRLTPTEWRRVATSLAASVAIAADVNLPRCEAFLSSEVFQRDPGVAASMVLGLPRAAEAEPEAAEALLERLVATGGFDMMEALLELQHERLTGPFGQQAFAVALSRLRQPPFCSSADDGRLALLELMNQELAGTKAQSTLRRALGEALQAFASQGARAAHNKAQGILGAVEATLARLEATDTSTAEGRRDAFRLLREIDMALLRTSQLSDLLLLAPAGADSAAHKKIGEAFQRLTDWLLAQEQEPVPRGSPIAHPSFRLHRLRTLLHVVDADGSLGEERGSGLRERRLKTATLLLSRARQDAPSPLRRVVCAAAARACDALLREEIAELSDVFLEVASLEIQAQDLATLGEASMDHDATAAFQAYAALVRQNEQAGEQALKAAGPESLRELARAFPLVGSPRVEALRTALLVFADAVDAVLAVRSVSELAVGAEGATSRIASLAAACRSLAQLVVGARRRLGTASSSEARASGTAVRMIDLCVEHTLRGHAEMFGEILPDVESTLRQEIPGDIADIAVRALLRLQQLPVSLAAEPPVSEPEIHSTKELPLPLWLPPSRCLGGFYVLRPLGAGAVGSVFVACRSEDKNRRSAPRVALKVPEYGGDAARTLSEREFLQMFREEAGTLLAIPQHPNLARLITFDAGAVPKPILVMELVDGPTLEWLVQARTLNTQAALAILDGIAAGLGALHEAGVGHLDLKPSNVILRETSEQGPLSVDLSSLRTSPLLAGADRGQEGSLPVLVDFGLAGRKLRPGCATTEYGAPEIWGPAKQALALRPQEADVYAFGCVVWEVLTATELFQGATPMAVLLAHLSHDGGPECLATAQRKPALRGLVELLHSLLRKEPAKRISIAQARRELLSLGPELLSLQWPITP